MATLLRCGMSGSMKSRLKVMNGFSMQKNLSSAPPMKTKTQVETTRQWTEVTSLKLDQSRKPSLCFDDPVAVFQHKTTWQLCRAVLILKICTYDLFVNNCETCLTRGQRLLGKRLFNALLKPTVYQQFVAGDCRQEIQACVTELKKAGIGALISVPMEEDIGESVKEEDLYNGNLLKTLNAINIAADVETRFPMATISKLHNEPSLNPELVRSVAVAMDTGKEVMSFSNLSEEDHYRLVKGLERLKAIGQLADEKNVIVMVDAECTYLNPALNLFSLAMMLNYNKQAAIIFYTYQNYLKSTPERLRRDVRFIDECGVCFGAKLVRGAYMIRERCLADTQGYPDPIQATFEDTSNTYHNSMEFMLSRISKDPDKTRIIIASHNQQTVELAIERMRQYRFDPSNGSVFFGQVMGIGDHITYQLGVLGWPIYKAIPIGSMMDTLPYLSRRVLESRALLEGTSQERKLLSIVLKGRLLGT